MGIHHVAFTTRDLAISHAFHSGTITARTPV